jgi:hypothetical protein
MKWCAKAWEKGERPITGPASVAIRLMLSNTMSLY